MRSRLFHINARAPGPDPKAISVAPELIVSLRGVARTFETRAEEVVAVRDVDLELLEGEWIAVMGPSGSGKTTLINLIAGLDRASAGTVMVMGQDLSSLSESALTSYRAQNLGLVFQDPHLLPGLTATENVVAARLPWESGSTLEPRARQLLARVGLGQRADFPPARLSGGERQRVAVARALLGEPALLLADEPTGNLDRDATNSLLDLLSGLQGSMGLTLIVATHDALVASRASRVVMLRDGHMDGQALESTRPANS